jgi:glucose/mannose transport system substrate-binding protein
MIGPVGGRSTRSRRCSALGGVLAGLALVSTACTGTSGQPITSQIELLHWWTAPGEKDAIDALLAAFERTHPNDVVRPIAIIGSDHARAAINFRMTQNSPDPPDTFQANGGWDLLGWVVYNGVDASAIMTPIDDIFTELAGSTDWTRVFPEPILRTVSFAGRPYAVPLSIHRLNTLFYDKALFERWGETPPATLPALFELAARFQARGITPIALGTHDTSTLSLLFFENILVADAGGAFYRRFFGGPGDAFAPEIQKAVEDLRTLVSYTNKDRARKTWSEAVNLLGAADSPAAMTIMGDWARASLERIPGLDFGAVPFPGTDQTFVFTTDTFGFPTGARHPDGLRRLLRFFGSTEGQDTFNPIKGSIPARSDADITKYTNDIAKQTIDAFRQASLAGTSNLVPATAILAPQAYIDAVNAALDEFVGSGPMAGNTSVVVHTLDNWRDVLSTSPLR